MLIKKNKKVSLWIAEDLESGVCVYLSKPVKKFNVWICSDITKDVFMPIKECSMRLQKFIANLNLENIKNIPVEIENAQMFIDYNKISKYKKKL